MKGNYYAQKLYSDKLYQVYQTQIDRVKQYLDAEINFIRNYMTGNEKALELGAGYGRIMKELAPYAKHITGIDNSRDSVIFGKEYLKEFPNCSLLVMDAHNLEFAAEFDLVICLQNGLSAIKGDPYNLVVQGLKVLSPGGKAFYSTYSPNFWEYRLAWFQEQANKGLLGEIDQEKTKNGKIVCTDGFVATTFTEEDLEQLGQTTGYSYKIAEVDQSSVFLILEKSS